MRFPPFGCVGAVRALNGEFVIGLLAINRGFTRASNMLSARGLVTLAGEMMEGCRVSDTFAF
jgi:hypothetical protein